MTDQQHQITPPPELVDQWHDTYYGPNGPEIKAKVSFRHYIADQAARWGADTELEACCDSLQELLAPSNWITGLRAARRPKPPSLKEQALEELNKWREVIGASQLDNIRRALEQLND